MKTKMMKMNKFPLTLLADQAMESVNKTRTRTKMKINLVLVDQAKESVNTTRTRTRTKMKMKINLARAANGDRKRHNPEDLDKKNHVKEDARQETGLRKISAP